LLAPKIPREAPPRPPAKKLDVEEEDAREAAGRELLPPRLREGEALRPETLRVFEPAIRGTSPVE
jgi:hypothetical protein